MLTDRIDPRRLARDIELSIADCIHLKRVLGRRWTRPMAEEQRRLTRIRRRLTGLFILVALSRGRLHVRRPPREVRDAAGPGFDPSAWDAAAYCGAIAARGLPDYLLASTMTEAAR